MQGLQRDIAKQIRAQSKRVIAPIWTEALQGHTNTRLEAASILRSASVAVRDSNVTLQAGGKGTFRRRVPVKAVEFGAEYNTQKTYTTRSRKGKSYRVTRYTQHQLPIFKKTGHVVFPAAAYVIPRIASLWVQTTLRSFYEALGRK